MNYPWSPPVKGETTLGEIVSTIGQITGRGDPDEAAAYLEAYRAISEHAEENIGYATGYLSFEEMPKALRLFNVEHPILGGALEAESATPDSAVLAGAAAFYERNHKSEL